MTANPPLQESFRQRWLGALAVYRQPRVLAIFALGFGAGLPFLLVFSTLSAWLTELGATRTAIGFFGWVGITYSIKVLWAPVIDQLRLPLLHRLGQRRSWVLAGQLGIMLGLTVLAWWVPQGLPLEGIALLAVWVAFSSATQDVAIDALRIESAVVEEQGALSAAYIFGYRVALLAAGAGALALAQWGGWSLAYQLMALLLLPCVLTVLWMNEPPVQERETPPRGWRRVEQSVVAPFRDFFQRNGSLALWILAFIGLFRLSDITLGIMANPFYLDLGFSKGEIATIAKGFGFGMSLLGSFIGGLWVVRWGVYRPLLIGALLVSLTNLLFIGLAALGPEIAGLALVISADNLSGGIATTAFVAYLSGLTNRAYTATQYALFSSLMTLPGKFLSGFSGWWVDALGYPGFFALTTVLGLPAIALVYWLARRSSVALDDTNR